MAVALRFTARPRVRHLESGQVTAYELASRGLDEWPSAVGVYWLHSQRTLCRGHVELAVVRDLIGVLADEEDIAAVLAASHVSEYRARRWCVLCPDSDTGRGSVA
jgi:hypothetical protein